MPLRRTVCEGRDTEIWQSALWPPVGRVVTQVVRIPCSLPLFLQEWPLSLLLLLPLLSPLLSPLPSPLPFPLLSLLLLSPHSLLECHFHPHLWVCHNSNNFRFPHLANRHNFNRQGLSRLPALLHSTHPLHFPQEFVLLALLLSDFLEHRRWGSQEHHLRFLELHLQVVQFFQSHILLLQSIAKSFLNSSLSFLCLVSSEEVAMTKRHRGDKLLSRENFRRFFY
jgi:hypothetical protein